ncbi:MAG: hypothetical protein J0M17_08900 [Planctomycetes bacterium]|nr:hypothetical protein [Planctomycetota bacterium]
MDAVHRLGAWLIAPHTLWVALWTGLGVFTVVLLTLLHTKLGKTKPVQKCAILAIWFHLLLLIYATSVTIVAERAGGGGQVTINLGLSDNATKPPTAALKPPMPTRASPAKDILPKSAAPRVRTAANSAAVEKSATGMSSGVPVKPQAVSDAGNRALPKVEISPPKLNTAALTKLKTTAPAKLANLPDPLVAMTSPSPAKLSEVPGAMTPIPRSATPLPASPPNVAAKLLPIAPAPMAQTLPKDHHQPPPLYQQRVASDRLQIAAAHGGSLRTEAAVNAALQWLATHQEADGRWSPQRFGAGHETEVLGHNRGGAGANADTGITGLALLALLGAGHTQERGDHQKAVAAGVKFLIETQHPNGNLGGNAEPFAFMYCHGMAALALSEAYAMTSDAALEQPVRRAIDYTLKCQNRATGGWRYRPQEAGDLSQLGWQLMALKSAELAGVEVPSEARDGMIRFLQGVTSGPAGGYASYRAGERVSRPMTAEALVCKQFLGMARQNPAGDEAGDLLLGELPGLGERNFYYWYYGTLGMYQLQGDHWRRWNDALTGELLKSQIQSGDEAGTWEPNDVWGGYGGRVYSTALATLCLEVYYRYLPLYVEAANNGGSTQRK